MEETEVKIKGKYMFHLKYRKDYDIFYKLCMMWRNLKKIKRIKMINGFYLYMEEEDYSRIREAIYETREILEKSGYWECYGECFCDMAMLVIYAKKYAFFCVRKFKDNNNKYLQEYMNIIKQLVEFYYWRIIVYHELFHKVESEELRYLLFGKLLVIAGYDKYDEFDSSYKSEADYYYKTLNIKEIVDKIE